MVLGIEVGVLCAGYGVIKVGNSLDFIGIGVFWGSPYKKWCNNSGIKVFLLKFNP